jgi:benzoate-CoA ligase
MTAKTAAELGVPERFNAAAHFVDRHLGEGRGGRVAIECGTERVTYAQLAERVSRCAWALQRTFGVHAGARVALLLLDDPAFFYAFFGAIKIGAVPVPLNTMWKAADYAFALADSDAAVLIVSDALRPQVDAIPRDQVPELRHVLTHGNGDGLDAIVRDGPSLADAADTGRDDPAFWLYSSGSTGRPKGCVHLHHDMVVCAELFAKGVLGIREHDRCFSGAKLFFAYGLGNAGYFPLAVGATSILWPGSPTPADVYRIVDTHRPTIFSFVPTGYAMLLAHAGEAGSMDSIRLAVSAGEALPPALYSRFKERFGIEILDGIGSTETLHMFISNRPGAIRPGSSGLVVDGYETAILDDDRRPVAGGAIGNLWIAGDSICAGYWHQPEKTAETIDGAWIRTGDKYSRDADGCFWYAGRSDDMLKVGGQWVSPAEVEYALAEHDAVQECAIIGRDDADALQKPMAFVVLRGGVAGTPELAGALQRFVRERLADYKRPRWVEFVAELPKTATGKIQRFKLRQIVANISGDPPV